MRSLDIGALGMMAQSTNVDVTSNNIANMTTTGYKRQRAEFQDLLYQDLRRAGSPSSDTGTIVPVGVQVGLGVKTAAIGRYTGQGSVTLTENELDVALQGRGYFQVDLPSGETAYTRDGTFKLDGNGQIVTKDGYAIQPGITVPNNATSVTINGSGEVYAEIDGQVAPQNLGQIQLATFINPAGMSALGDNLFLETDASGTPNTGTAGSVGFGTLLQGYLESSNVNVVQEITNLIKAQRAYEMNSKSISTTDEMMSAISNLR
ncbi:flagellar basal-body rod protein FlgG [Thalassospira sp. NFXS8]|jgi:flagellar basal-body rod protein FlgG|uniref:flagellar basal-body rod protein FlgG n=1 Tax=Thalassospira sp. NFXS8 TaxID=2819093 RepID=UPI0032DE3BE1